MSVQGVFYHPGRLLQAPRQVFCAWGLVLVIHADDSATCLTEKPLVKKVELLYNKNLYPVALSLARSEQVGVRWREHLCPDRWQSNTSLLEEDSCLARLAQVPAVDSQQSYLGHLCNR